MSKKSTKIAALIAEHADPAVNPHYAGFFRCFNLGQFYEAHDVLEELWLEDRRGPDGNFYKALIQLAGAFVHLRHNRLRPAASLFKLAEGYLSAYPQQHAGLDVAAVVALMRDWRRRLEQMNFTVNPLTPTNAPMLELSSPEPARGG